MSIFSKDDPAPKPPRELGMDARLQGLEDRWRDTANRQKESITRLLAERTAMLAKIELAQEALREPGLADPYRISAALKILAE